MAFLYTGCFGQVAQAYKPKKNKNIIKKKKSFQPDRHMEALTVHQFTMNGRHR